MNYEQQRLTSYQQYCSYRGKPETKEPAHSDTTNEAASPIDAVEAQTDKKSSGAESSKSPLDRRLEEIAGHSYETGGLTVQALFPEIADDERVLTVSDVLERYGLAKTRLILNDIIEANVSYSEDCRDFVLEDVGRYAMENVTLRLDLDFPLYYDESGHFIHPLQWHNNDYLALLAEVDTHYWHWTAMTWGILGEVHRQWCFQPTPADQATHLLFQGYWGGPRGEKLGMPEKTLETYFPRGIWRKSASKNDREGKDYICVPIDNDEAKATVKQMSDRLLAGLMEGQKCFWKKRSLINSIARNNELLAGQSEDYFLSRLKWLSQRCLGQPVASNPNVRIPHFMELLAPKYTYPDYTSSVLELQEMMLQQITSTEDNFALASMMEDTVETWCKFAPLYQELHDLARESFGGWIDIFGDHAVLSYPRPVANGGGRNGRTEEAFGFCGSELKRATALVNKLCGEEPRENPLRKGED